MLQTAFQAAGIALAFSGVVVLVSSRSIILTLFSLLTIGYVLTATTALLVASGWTLGFLESICFAILIGISCDFVIHFGHAYAFQPGKVSRHERTKYALVRMGPSILAAAFTTVFAAVIMLFTVISFFRQFAQILFYTVLQATIGSFVMYLTLTDCLGPEEPTYLVDKFVAWCKARYCCSRQSRMEEEEPEEAAIPPPDVFLSQRDALPEC
jgi:predicted RND superfamily exporter protein